MSTVREQEGAAAERAWLEFAEQDDLISVDDLQARYAFISGWGTRNQERFYPDTADRDPQMLLERNADVLSDGLQRAAAIAEAVATGDTEAARAGTEDLVLNFIRPLTDDEQEQLLMNTLLNVMTMHRQAEELHERLKARTRFGMN